jgi:hypothetical protein
MRRHQHHAEALVRQVDVVYEAPAAPQKPRIFDAPDRSADTKPGHERRDH